WRGPSRMDRGYGARLSAGRWTSWARVPAIARTGPQETVRSFILYHLCGLCGAQPSALARSIRVIARLAAGQGVEPAQRPRAVRIHATILDGALVRDSALRCARRMGLIENLRR